MKIGYKKSYMRSHLIFGLFWAIFFLLFIFTDDDIRWFHFGYLAIAAMYLGMYLYQKRNGYLSLENGVLRINDLLGKHIPLPEVTHCRYFAGDYILENATQKIKINTQLLDQASQQLLKTELAKYGLEPGTVRNVQVKSN